MDLLNGTPKLKWMEGYGSWFFHAALHTATIHPAPTGAGFLIKIYDKSLPVGKVGGPYVNHGYDNDLDLAKKMAIRMIRDSLKDSIEELETEIQE